MKLDIAIEDLRRLPMETRVLWDMLIEQGAKPAALSGYACRKSLKDAALRDFRVTRGERWFGRNVVPRFTGGIEWGDIDAWDMRPRAEIRHAPTAKPFDFGALNAIFKETHSADRIASLAYESSPFLSMMPQ